MMFLNRWKNTDSGFTLLEVVLVLAVMSSLIFLSLGSVGYFEKKYVQNAAEELKSDIQYIQGMELNTSIDYIIVFSTSGYNIYKASTFTQPIKQVKPKGIERITVTNSRGDSFLEFTKRGTTDSGSATITLFSENYSQTITTYLGTGYVSINEIKISK